MAKKNSNLRAAAGTKNDDFYTYLEDIENELRHYKEHFKDKVVLCPCDESEHTNFFKHFTKNIEQYGFKKLVCIGYRENRPAEVHIVECANGEQVEKNEQIVGSGDFRNEATQKYYDEADVIVTNPPFSLFREFVDLLMKKNKKFLIIGNQNAISYKEIFPLIKENKIWMGYTSPKQFMDRTKDNEPKKFGNITWFTNLDIKKRKFILDTGIQYECGIRRGWYQKYDNYDAINVNKVIQIPMDYDGVMGVPITFLDKYNPDQFEILGLFNGYAKSEPEKGFICGDKMPYVNKGKTLYTTGPVIDGQNIYARILIRAKR